MTVAFIGHRNVDNSQSLKLRVTEIIEKLIVEKNADNFLFGSKSEFDNLCYEVVTEQKKKYPQICRVFVRAEYEYINESYSEYLSSLYEDTFFPTQVHGAGALSYIKRNKVMIDMTDFLVVYFNEDYVPKSKTKSGTKIAVNYAQGKNVPIINLFE